MNSLNSTSFVLAVTGGLACGKSEVGRILQQHGFLVCDADEVAHDLMKKGQGIYQAVVDCFGEQILAENGEISRPELGKIVFENPAQLQKLNALVHPSIRKVLMKKMATFRKSTQPAAVLIPLLFEAKMEDLDWDAILCVSAEEEVVFDRLEKRGFNRRESAERIAAQFSLKEKESRSDVVLRNSGSLDNLESKLIDLVDQMQKKFAGKDCYFPAED